MFSFDTHFAGYELLKKKADALKARFRKLLTEIKDAKLALAEEMPKSFISLASAQYTAGKFGDDVIYDVKDARVRVFGKFLSLCVLLSFEIRR